MKGREENQDFPPPEVWKKGLLPWSLEEFKEAMDYVDKLIETPKDDWDLRQRPSILLEHDETGDVEEIRFNPFHIENQIGEYFIKRYTDTTESFVHSYRFFMIRGLLFEHSQVLFDEGLAKQDDECVMYSDSLLKSLCVLPYSRLVKDEDGALYYFSIDEVVKKAKQFEEE
ncbi:MAG: hypothetical protein V3V94_02660 [Candidatus Brocadiales bacterium]